MVIDLSDWNKKEAKGQKYLKIARNFEQNVWVLKELNISPLNWKGQTEELNCYSKEFKRITID